MCGCDAALRRLILSRAAINAKFKPDRPLAGLVQALSPGSSVWLRYLRAPGEADLQAQPRPRAASGRRLGRERLDLGGIPGPLSADGLLQQGKNRLALLDPLAVLALQVARGV